MKKQTFIQAPREAEEALKNGKKVNILLGESMVEFCPIENGREFFHGEEKRDTTQRKRQAYFYKIIGRDLDATMDIFIISHIRKDIEE